MFWFISKKHKLIRKSLFSQNNPFQKLRDHFFTSKNERWLFKNVSHLHRLYHTISLYENPYTLCCNFILFVSGYNRVTKITPGLLTNRKPFHVKSFCCKIFFNNIYLVLLLIAKYSDATMLLFHIIMSSFIN